MRSDRIESVGGGVRGMSRGISTGMAKGIAKSERATFERGLPSDSLTKGSNKDLGKQIQMRRGEVSSSNRQPRVGGHAN